MNKILLTITVVIAAGWISWKLYIVHENEEAERREVYARIARKEAPGRMARIDWIRPNLWVYTDGNIEERILTNDKVRGVTWRDAILERDNGEEKERRYGLWVAGKYLQIANGTRIKVEPHAVFSRHPSSRRGDIADGPHQGRMIYFDERLVRYEDQ